MNKYNILYIDDEDANLRVFQAAFRREYNIYLAESGEEALKILEEHEIQLVITDQKMPNMTGVELLEIITPKYPDIIKIILTGYSDVKDIIRALNRCGIFRYIMKPWDKQEMLNTIQKALESYQLKKDNVALVSRLKSANEELETKVEDRTKELSVTNMQLKAEIAEREEIQNALQIAKEKAEGASKAKELFLSSMSHEMRTPLNAIIGMSHLLAQSDLDEDQRENLGVLRFSATNLLSIINDILDFSKIEAEKIELERTSFNLTHLLSRIYKSHIAKAKEKGLRYHFNADEQIPRQVIGDPTRLAQIVNNLLGNAMKFTEKGEVRLSVQSTNQLINGNPVIQFSIIDTGIGIEANKTGDIFEYFTQASSSTTRKFGGTGLGLAISKKLVELQEGKIWVESTLGEGASFIFQIPYQVVPQSEESNDTQQIEVKNKNLSAFNVLVVEDNRVNQILMRKVLSNWKAKFDFADDGKMALEKIESMAYDVVLMDIQMPEMDGYEATRVIRKMENDYFREVPILALTASTLQQERTEAFESGMDDFVLKPFEPEDLYSKIYNHAKGFKGNKDTTDSDMENSKIHLQSLKEVMDGDEQEYKELLVATRENFQEFESSIDKLISQNDAEDFVKNYHKVKPSLKMLRLMKLKGLVDDVRNSGNAPEQTGVLKHEVHDINEEIEAELRKLNS